ALLTMIDKENADHEHLFITRKVKDCWDGQLAQALVDKARDEKMKPGFVHALLADLLDHEVKEARAFAASLIPRPLPSGEPRKKPVVAAVALMTHARDAGWSVVWPAIQSDAEFGREVITALADSIDPRSGAVGR